MLATFEECPFDGTSFTVHYTVVQCGKLLKADESVNGWFEAFSEVIVGRFEPFSLVLLA